MLTLRIAWYQTLAGKLQVPSISYGSFSTSRNEVTNFHDVDLVSYFRAGWRCLLLPPLSFSELEPFFLCKIKSIKFFLLMHFFYQDQEMTAFPLSSLIVFFSRRSSWLVVSWKAIGIITSSLDRRKATF